MKNRSATALWEACGSLSDSPGTSNYSDVGMRYTKSEAKYTNDAPQEATIPSDRSVENLQLLFALTVGKRMTTHQEPEVTKNQLLKTRVHAHNRHNARAEIGFLI